MATTNGHEQETRMDTKEHKEQDEPRMNADTGAVPEKRSLVECIALKVTSPRLERRERLRVTTTADGGRAAAHD
jgi:hypothetical protein